MLSSVEVRGSDQVHLLKFGAGAMMRVERALKVGIMGALGSMQGESFRIETLVVAIGAAMNDGKGGSEDEALALIDDIGLPAAMEALNEALTAAFPASAEQSEGGNASGEGGQPRPRKKAA